ncbi:MAG: hypothetical protein E2O79_09995 [Caldithrix sp.]|nr:MAG: hypothetical protein E2O79_09995 [Caldithrix sp.]
MIKTHPILFSGPMVRAILEDRKTQTRRIIKPQPTIENGVFEWLPKKKMLYAYQCVNCEPDMSFYSPYGRLGDLLWVRENWGYHGMGKSSTDRWKTKNMGVSYHADGRRTSGLDYEGADVLKLPADYPVGKVVTMPDDLTNEECHAWWHRKKSIPSIHMPRWVNRITLEIKDIRVERLQDISEEDAKAEGIFFTDYGRNCYHRGGAPQDVGDCPAPNEDPCHPQRNGWSHKKTTSHDQCLATAKSAFGNLWQSINGQESWDENPWVWPVTFESHLCNIDEYMKQAA